MLIVAVIAGGVTLIAVVGAVGFRKYQQAAAPSEAPAMLMNVVGGELAALASSGKYTECAGGPYPRLAPDPRRHAWTALGHPGAPCWAALAASPGPVRFVYRVVAGGPSDPVPSPPKSGLTMPSPTGPWFVAMAAADLDGDGDRSSYWVTSFAPGVSSVDPDE
ncbi:MAG: hypothetical protein WKG00_18340 [Polyangiaceae bacterium]